MSVIRPEDVKAYVKLIDRGISDLSTLRNNLYWTGLSIWRDKGTTGDPLKDWAIVNCGVNYETNYLKGLEYCNALNEHLTSKKGEFILIHEDWKHPEGSSRYKLFLGVLSGEGLKVTREERFDSEDYYNEGTYTSWDPRCWEQPMLLEACLEPGSKLYVEDFDTHSPDCYETRDHLEITIEQKPLVLNARMFKKIWDERKILAANPGSLCPEFKSNINLPLLQCKEYLIEDVCIMVGADRILEYMKKISKNPKILSAQKPEELIELLK